MQQGDTGSEQDLQVGLLKLRWLLNRLRSASITAGYISLRQVESTFSLFCELISAAVISFYC
jgi:hypothetical protein